MKNLNKKDRLSELFMILPALIFYVTFVIYPLFGAINFSLTNWDGVQSTYSYVGLSNYITLFQDTYVLEPLRNSFIYAFATMITMNVLALLFAIGLDREIRGKNFLRACMFLPALLSPLVVGFIFSFIYSYPLAELGKALNIEWLANNVLGNRNLSLLAVIIAATWRMVGWYMVVYLAGLQSIPGSLIEAAKIDGASPWQRFKNITFPLIAPAFTINMVLSVERAFKEYDIAFSLTGGGPGNSSELIAMTVYKESFTNRRTGYGSAVGVVLFMIIVAISLIQMKWLRGREDNVEY